MRAQLHGGDPAGSAEEVTGRLLAIQAQDLRRAAYGPDAVSGIVCLGRRRCPFPAAFADRHLAEPRYPAPGPLRGLLVAASADHPAAVHLELRLLAQEGVPAQDAERAMATVQAALAADGPLTRSQLRERV